MWRGREGGRLFSFCCIQLLSPFIGPPILSNIESDDRFNHKPVVNHVFLSNYFISISSFLSIAVPILSVYFLIKKNATIHYKT